MTDRECWCRAGVSCPLCLPELYAALAPEEQEAMTVLLDRLVACRPDPKWGQSGPNPNRAEDAVGPEFETVYRPSTGHIAPPVSSNAGQLASGHTRAATSPGQRDPTGQELGGPGNPSSSSVHMRRIQKLRQQQQQQGRSRTAEDVNAVDAVEHPDTDADVELRLGQERRDAAMAAAMARPHTADGSVYSRSAGSRLDDDPSSIPRLVGSRRAEYVQLAELFVRRILPWQSQACPKAIASLCRHHITAQEEKETLERKDHRRVQSDIVEHYVVDEFAHQIEWREGERKRHKEFFAIQQELVNAFYVVAMEQIERRLTEQEQSRVVRERQWLAKLDRLEHDDLWHTLYQLECMIKQEPRPDIRILKSSMEEARIRASAQHRVRRSLHHQNQTKSFEWLCCLANNVVVAATTEEQLQRTRGDFDGEATRQNQSRGQEQLRMRSDWEAVVEQLRDIDDEELHRVNRLTRRQMACAKAFDLLADNIIQHDVRPDMLDSFRADLIWESKRSHDASLQLRRAVLNKRKKEMDEFETWQRDWLKQMRTFRETCLETNRQSDADEDQILGDRMREASEFLARHVKVECARRQDILDATLTLLERNFEEEEQRVSYISQVLADMRKVVDNEWIDIYKQAHLRETATLAFVRDLTKAFGNWWDTRDEGSLATFDTEESRWSTWFEQLESDVTRDIKDQQSLRDENREKFRQELREKELLASRATCSRVSAVLLPKLKECVPPWIREYAGGRPLADVQVDEVVVQIDRHALNTAWETEYKATRKAQADIMHSMATFFRREEHGIEKWREVKVNAMHLNCLNAEQDISLFYSSGASELRDWVQRMETELETKVLAQEKVETQWERASVAHLLGFWEAWDRKMRLRRKEVEATFSPNEVRQIQDLITPDAAAIVAASVSASTTQGDLAPPDSVSNTGFKLHVLKNSESQHVEVMPIHPDAPDDAEYDRIVHAEHDAVATSMTSNNDDDQLHKQNTGDALSSSSAGTPSAQHTVNMPSHNSDAAASSSRGPHRSQKQQQKSPQYPQGPQQAQHVQEPIAALEGAMGQLDGTSILDFVRGLRRFIAELHQPRAASGLSYGCAQSMQHPAWYSSSVCNWPALETMFCLVACNVAHVDRYGAVDIPQFVRNRREDLCSLLVLCDTMSRSLLPRDGPGPAAAAGSAEHEHPKEFTSTEASSTSATSGGGAPSAAGGAGANGIMLPPPSRGKDEDLSLFTDGEESRSVRNDGFDDEANQELVGAIRDWPSSLSRGRPMCLPEGTVNHLTLDGELVARDVVSALLLMEDLPVDTAGDRILLSSSAGPAADNAPGTPLLREIEYRLSSPPIVSGQTSSRVNVGTSAATDTHAHHEPTVATVGATGIQTTVSSMQVLDDCVQQTLRMFGVDAEQRPSGSASSNQAYGWSDGTPSMRSGGCGSADGHEMRWTNLLQALWGLEFRGRLSPWERNAVVFAVALSSASGTSSLNNGPGTTSASLPSVIRWSESSLRHVLCATRYVSLLMALAWMEQRTHDETVSSILRVSEEYGLESSRNALSRFGELGQVEAKLESDMVLVVPGEPEPAELERFTGAANAKQGVGTGGHAGAGGSGAQKPPEENDGSVVDSVDRMRTWLQAMMDIPMCPLSRRQALTVLGVASSFDPTIVLPESCLFADAIGSALRSVLRGFCEDSFDVRDRSLGETTTEGATGTDQDAEDVTAASAVSAEEDPGCGTGPWPQLLAVFSAHVAVTSPPEALSIARQLDSVGHLVTTDELLRLYLHHSPADETGGTGNLVQGSVDEGGDDDADPAATLNNLLSGATVMGGGDGDGQGSTSIAEAAELAVSKAGETEKLSTRGMALLTVVDRLHDVIVARQDTTGSLSAHPSLEGSGMLPNNPSEAPDDDSQQPRPVVGATAAGAAFLNDDASASIGGASGTDSVQHTQPRGRQVSNILTLHLVSGGSGSQQHQYQQQQQKQAQQQLAKQSHTFYQQQHGRLPVTRQLSRVALSVPEDVVQQAYADARRVSESMAQVGSVSTAVWFEPPKVSKRRSSMPVYEAQAHEVQAAMDERTSASYEILQGLTVRATSNEPALGEPAGLEPVVNDGPTITPTGTPAGSVSVPRGSLVGAHVSHSALALKQALTQAVNAAEALMDEHRVADADASSTAAPRDSAVRFTDSHAAVPVGVTIEKTLEEHKQARAGGRHKSSSTPGTKRIPAERASFAFESAPNPSIAEAETTMEEADQLIAQTASWAHLQHRALLEEVDVPTGVLLTEAVLQTRPLAHIGVPLKWDALAIAQELEQAYGFWVSMGQQQRQLDEIAADGDDAHSAHSGPAANDTTVRKGPFEIFRQVQLENALVEIFVLLHSAKAIASAERRAREMQRRPLVARVERAGLDDGNTNDANAGFEPLDKLSWGQLMIGRFNRMRVFEDELRRRMIDDWIDRVILSRRNRFSIRNAFKQRRLALYRERERYLLQHYAHTTNYVDKELYSLEDKLSVFAMRELRRCDGLLRKMFLALEAYHVHQERHLDLLRATWFKLQRRMEKRWAHLYNTLTRLDAWHAHEGQMVAAAHKAHLDGIWRDTCDEFMVLWNENLEQPALEVVHFETDAIAFLEEFRESWAELKEECVTRREDTLRQTNEQLKEAFAIMERETEASMDKASKTSQQILNAWREKIDEVRAENGLRALSGDANGRGGDTGGDGAHGSDGDGDSAAADKSQFVTPGQMAAAQRLRNKGRQTLRSLASSSQKELSSLRQQIEAQRQAVIEQMNNREATLNHAIKRCTGALAVAVAEGESSLSKAVRAMLSEAGSEFDALRTKVEEKEWRQQKGMRDRFANAHVLAEREESRHHSALSLRFRQADALVGSRWLVSMHAADKLQMREHRALRRYSKTALQAIMSHYRTEEHDTDVLQTISLLEGRVNDSRRVVGEYQRLVRREVQLAKQQCAQAVKVWHNRATQASVRSEVKSVLHGIVFEIECMTANTACWEETMAHERNRFRGRTAHVTGMQKREEEAIASFQKDQEDSFRDRSQNLHLLLSTTKKECVSGLGGAIGRLVDADSQIQADMEALEAELA